MLFIHLLAETVAVPYLDRNGSELTGKVDFEEVKHGVEGDEELVVGVGLDVLDEEVVGGEVGGELVEVDFAGKGDQEPYLLLVHITMLIIMDSCKKQLIMLTCDDYDFELQNYGMNIIYWIL